MTLSDRGNVMCACQCSGLLLISIDHDDWHRSVIVSSELLTSLISGGLVLSLLYK